MGLADCQLGLAHGEEQGRSDLSRETCRRRKAGPRVVRPPALARTRDEWKAGRSARRPSRRPVRRRAELRDWRRARRAPHWRLSPADRRNQGRPRERSGAHWYARHDQQLGGASPLWRLMAPTTSRWQLLRREAGGKEAGDEIATLGTHGAPADRWLPVCCAYEAGRSGRAGQVQRSPMSSRGRCVDAVGVR